MIDDERIERALRAGPADEPDYRATTPDLGTSRAGGRGRGSLRDLVATVAVAAAIVFSVILLRQGASTDPGPGGHDLLADVRAAGRIRIAVTTGSPQVDVSGTGYAGFDLDVASAIGERLGIPVQVDLVDPSQIGPGHWADRWDLALDSQVSTPQRADRLRLGAPYYVRSGAILVPLGSPVRQPADLAGRTVCVVAGGVAERWLAGSLQLLGGRIESPPIGANVTTGRTADECLTSIRSGGVAAFIADWTLDVSSIPAGLVGLPDAPFIGSVAPALDRARPGVAALADEVDRIIAGLRADGTLRSLSERRFGGQDLTSLSLP